MEATLQLSNLLDETVLGFISPLIGLITLGWDRCDVVVIGRFSTPLLKQYQQHKWQSGTSQICH